MNGFLHFFFASINPMTNLGFSRAIPELTSSALPPWWVFAILPFVIRTFPDIVTWLVYVVKPNWIRPALPRRPRQAEPLVSIVIAGRNESATIGECIRGALLCGYANLEVIFVDDHSADNSVAVARRAALSVTRTRHDTGRVRIFPSPRRNGKASSLNIGIRMARGDFIAITDADSVIQHGAMQHWLLPFADPRIGAVSANIRTLNGTVNLLTRLQEVEYAMMFSLARFTMSRLGILNIISGMGGLFRAEILRGLGGFDTGLGDDTDLTTRIYKQGWKLGFSFDAVVWTTVPITRYHLWRQRMRWRRNLIKIRVSKHRDQFLLGRYGFANAVRALMIVGGPVLLPPLVVIGLSVVTIEYGPLSAAQILTNVYWVSVLYVLIRILISRDICGTPLPVSFLLIFLAPCYFVWLLGPLLYAEFCELFRIGTKHPYVPDHIWREIPWW